MMYFGFEGYEVFRETPVRIIVTKDNELLFCGIDVARLLNYKYPSAAVYNNCPNGILVNYYLSKQGRMCQSVFIKQDDLLNLIKNRVSDTERFITDIINGKEPEVKIGKSDVNIALINLNKSEQIVIINNKSYKITVKPND